MNQKSENDIMPAQASGAKKWLGMGVRYGLPVVLTVLLVVYMFKKVNFS